MIVQCKREAKSVELDEIRQLAGAKLYFRADVAIFAALSFQGGSTQIREYEEKCGLTLWNAEKLSALASALVSNSVSQPRDWLRIMPVVVNNAA